MEGNIDVVLHFVMGSSSKLGVSSPHLTDHELDYLAQKQKPEDIIFDDICQMRNISTDALLKPTQLQSLLMSDVTLLSCLYPGMEISAAKELLHGRLDRCLVSALASTLCDNSNVLETGTYAGFTTALTAFGLNKSSSSGLVFTVDLPTSNSTWGAIFNYH